MACVKVDAGVNLNDYQIYENNITGTSDEDDSSEDIENVVITKKLDFEYCNEKPGMLLIFNFKEIENKQSREGTEADVEALHKCFNELNYEIKDIYHNLSKDRVLEELRKIADEDYSERSSIILAFLTHGSAQGILYTTDGQCITTDEILSYLTSDKCPGLKGKPKFFIFQACKGEKSFKTLAPDLRTDSMPVSFNQRLYILPVMADILIAYSTVEGYVSFRHTSEGSWYIQELCKNISMYAKTSNVSSILEHTNGTVATKYIFSGDVLCSQMPCFFSTLTKQYYLIHKNDRTQNNSENTQLARSFIHKKNKLSTLFRGQLNIMTNRTS